MKYNENNTPQPESYKDVFTLIKSDCYRYAEKTDIKSMIKLYLKSSSFKYSFWMRMSVFKGMIYPFSKFMRKYYSIKYGLQIIGDNIGYGFRIGHAFGTIINPKTVIGDNCTVSQLTTIGENRGKAPIINDNVYISPGCNICGPINIGTNVTIGMRSVVVKDVNTKCIVAGNPAKVIGENAIPPVTYYYRR